MWSLPIGLATAALVALALVAGRSGGTLPMLTEIALVAAIGTGALFGLGANKFWRGTVMEALTGSGGRYVLFIGLAAFAVVEAHAVGAALAEGAPATSLVMLALPLVLAAVALVSATRAIRMASGEEIDSSEDGIASDERMGSEERE